MTNLEYPNLKIGVFLCECGKNIADKVDLAQLERKFGDYQNVVKVQTINLACSDEGADAIKNTISTEHLERIVFAGCSHRTQGLFFQDLMEDCSLNRYLCEIANIREQCSWVHSNKDAATKKASKIIDMAISKVASNEPLEPLQIEINKDVLIIGGGITGIQAALTIAERGYNAVLVEEKATLGGNLAAMAKVAPSFECSACILMGKARDLPKIQTLTNSQILDIKGSYGNFNVKIKSTPRFVNEKTCTNCGACNFACLVTLPNEYEGGLSERKAIYLPYPHAYPLAHVVDIEHCNKCGDCIEVCEENAINLDQSLETLDLKVGAVIVAVGSKASLKGLEKYGYGSNKKVLDYLQFERMLSESGPTFGEVVDFMTAEPYKKLAFILLPEEQKLGYNRIENIVKQVTLYKNNNQDGEVFILTPNLDLYEKNETENLYQLKLLTNVTIIEGDVQDLSEQSNQMIINYSTKGTNEVKKLEVELVILSTGTEPIKIPGFDAKLSLENDKYGYYRESIPNIGVTVAGSCGGESSYEDCIRDGERAGLMSIGLLNEDVQNIEPMISTINTELCGGCAICVPLCPYGAIEVNEPDPYGQVSRSGIEQNNENENDNKSTPVAEVDQALCKGCGTCVAACPSAAASIRNMRDNQLLEIIKKAVGV